jgi:hypothetical protein
MVLSLNALLPARRSCSWFRTLSPVSATINTNLDPKLIVFSRYQIHLVNLKPYPHVPLEIDPTAYIATLLVSTG